MNTLRILSGAACMSMLLTTGAFAEILGVQPGTSDNPKDNVPKEIQREGGNFGSDGSGPGRRSDELVDMKKEKPEPVTQQQLEQNAEKTHGGGAAVAAERLKEKSTNKSKKNIKNKPRENAGASDARNDAPKANPREFQRESSDKAVQGQGLVNEQPMEKQQPANR